MVKIAIAGASGEVAREVIDVLVATQKHELLLLSRKEYPVIETMSGCEWVCVDYKNFTKLIAVLKGVHTVLCFITPQTDPINVAQRNLIDASVATGVKRFAPSEWATSSVEHMQWYAGKADIQQYLEHINNDQKILEYTLFQPGLFVNYFTHPHRSANHLSTFQTQIDFEHCRAIVPEGYNDIKITLTDVHDLAEVVAYAASYEGEWPVIGGVKGCELSLAELIRIGENVRGKSFAVEVCKIQDLKVGIVETSWLPIIEHAAISAEEARASADVFLSGMMLGMSVGALNVSDEWNRLLPNHKFVQPREFLFEAWSGKYKKLGAYDFAFKELSPTE